MPKLIDLVGQRFGRLKVLERDHSRKGATYWFCQCDCGNKVSVNGQNLKRGLTKSCGCLQKEKIKESLFKDKTGQKFGKLTVIKQDTTKDSSKGTYWLCQCDCGNPELISVHTCHLGKSTFSCGCLQKEKASQARLIDLTGQVFGKLTVLYREKSNNKNGRVHWICQCECGNICSVAGDYLKNGSTSSCGCINSKGEERIASILKSMDVIFNKQKTFQNLCGKNGYPLRFDFYLPEYNLCIEYQGIQHYQSRDFFGGEEQLKIQQEYDQKKEFYCKDNNIPLIIIPYTDLKKIDENYLQKLIYNAIHTVEN